MKRPSAKAVTSAHRQVPDAPLPSLEAALQLLRAEHTHFRPSRPVLIGVSGGQDSMVLLDCLVRLGWKKLVVCHVNHQLRGRESGQDAAFVRRVAAGYGLPCEVHRTDVTAIARERQLSLETAAREVRDAFFSEMSRKHRTRFVLLAHHADDQAETILANLCRGAALKGASGMELSSTSQHGILKLRPLLTTTREQITAYVSGRKLRYREDSSNQSSDFRRNRLRHEALPLLNDVFGRDVSTLLRRFASVASRDDEYLDALALKFLQTPGVLLPDGSLSLSVGGLQEEHAALQSRVLALWLKDHLQLGGIGHREIEAALSLLKLGGPAKINLPQGRWLRRKSRKLFVA